jgi:peptidoglycan/LPS O-acetylase OafA/YrhL
MAPADISRVPYLPGLDGMRAIAVVAVMVYHANPDWLPGGFLGVEVFFVISGYLITLLLISEKERTSSVDLRQFWIRRARRLLPAVFTMMIALTIWTALFERDALGKLRGDVIASSLYVMNWHQIWIGAGYTASNDFAPLRHLWSLAVEEQFYLIWPLVMFALLRGGSRRIADISRYLLVAALVITLLTAVLYHPGPVGTPDVTPEAYWTIFGRDISKVDALYLSTITRAVGLLLGAAFAMIWRPVALMRGPLRTKGRMLDGVALVGFVALGAMAWSMYLLGPDGANPWLFRGGFVLCGIATLMMIAAVTHERAATSRILSIPVLLWIGTRSYGLYLYHWPIYQLIRNIAGNHLKLHEFVLAMVATGIITEASYRFIETPIRTGTFRASLARIARSPVAGPRHALLGAGAVVGALTLFAGVSLATAPVEENEVRQTLEEGAAFTCDVVNDPTCSGADPADPADPPSVTGDGATPDAATDPSGSAVAPPPPAETTTTTTLPPAPIAEFALGDSVMLGAAGELSDRGFVVDAAESRQFSDGLAIVEQLNAADRLGDVVVVHLGTNGNIEPDDITAMMDALADVPQVLLLTIEVDRAWTDENNALIFDAAASYQNVSVLYWADLDDSCPGDCFQSDGFHLRPDGQAYYAALIEGALQAPA